MNLMSRNKLVGRSFHLNMILLHLNRSKKQKNLLYLIKSVTDIDLEMVVKDDSNNRVGVYTYIMRKTNT